MSRLSAFTTHVAKESDTPLDTPYDRPQRWYTKYYVDVDYGN
jgi:hypothetical protein